MRKAWEKEHPNRFAPYEIKKMQQAERVRKNREARLRQAARIVKLREVDKKTLRAIAEETGLTFQRVQQILKVIAPDSLNHGRRPE